MISAYVPASIEPVSRSTRLGIVEALRLRRRIGSDSVSAIWATSGTAGTGDSERGKKFSRPENWR
jgi:hypothetical protein